MFYGSADSKRVRSGRAGNETTDRDVWGESSEMGRGGGLASEQHAGL